MGRTQKPPTFRIPASQAQHHPLSQDIAFLRLYGVSLHDLLAAEIEARRTRVAASDALIASGLVSAARYYLCLADYLDLPFVAAGALLEPVDKPNEAIRQGRARLAHPPSKTRRFRGVDKDAARNGDTTAAWLLAPRGRDLKVLLDARTQGLGLPSLAITTPKHLSALVTRVGRASMAWTASFALLHRDPDLCAKHALDESPPWAIAGAVMIAAAAMIADPIVSAGLGLLFFAAMAFRLLVCAHGFAKPHAPAHPDDDGLPRYSIIVPLYHEAGMVRQLIEALDDLDYPAARLEILIVLEADDVETREALSTVALSPVYEVIVAPGGIPRTKPRALNIALPLLRGEIVTIYDAEDRPDPGQLREAAARFNAAPELACLQARLVVRPSTTDRLTRLFAIEYAALFDLYNVGIAQAGMPLALGGTSNHFRTRVLREVGGWDAWNVAEDADLGFRLARFGYGVGMLASITCEQAPEGYANWFKQRRRWTKGWIQTMIVLVRRPVRVASDLGAKQTAALVLMAVSLVLGPLLTPVAIISLIVNLRNHGMPALHDSLGIAIATLWVSVATIGVLAPLWCGYAGIKARGLEACMPSLPWVVIYQLAISAAAWAGLYDLIRRPYHWHKTEHRPD